MGVHRHIDDADVAGAHGGGDGRFLDALEHTFVKLAGAVDFALEDVVLDGFFGFGGDQFGLGGIAGGEQRFAAAGLLEIVADAVNDSFALTIERPPG